MGRIARIVDLPPIWLGAMLVLSWLLGGVVPIFRFDMAPLGPLVIAAGVALIAWSAWWFWRKRTPIEPRHTPTALIVEGPYRINRNPIYSGMVLILVGFGLMQGALSCLLPALLFPVLITKRFILAEEAALRTAFGAVAEDYFTRTRRWVL